MEDKEAKKEKKIKLPITARDIKRYKIHSEQFERESRHLNRWAMLMPIGQPFPTYSKAALKHAYFKKKKLTPIWEKIRSVIVPNTRHKSLWQHFPHRTEFDPPLYREIEPFLKKIMKERNNAP